jgi:hypothetical protein
MNQEKDKKVRFQKAIKELNDAMKELQATLDENKHVTISYESNPSRKIEDCSSRTIFGGINEDII